MWTELKTPEKLPPKTSRAMIVSTVSMIIILKAFISILHSSSNQYEMVNESCWRSDSDGRPKLATFFDTFNSLHPLMEFDFILYDRFDYDQKLQRHTCIMSAALVIAFSILLYRLQGQFTILNSSYNQNTTLHLSNSPYLASSSVSISSGVAFNVENGVEIILSGTSITCTSCYLNIGCGFTAHFIDSSKYHNQGVVMTLNGTYSYIHDHADPRMREDAIILEGVNIIARFCNVKFEGLRTALEGTRSISNVTIDNCEFGHMLFAQWIGRSSNVHVTDSYYHDMQRIAYGKAVYDNCKFEKYKVWDRSGVIAYNSEFIGNGGAALCIETAPPWLPNVESILENNTIINCTDTGIYVHTDNNIVRYNTFINNNIAITLNLEVSKLIVEYNNFMESNAIIIQGSNHDISVPYNYWGVDTGDTAEIRSKFADVCSDGGNGWIIWWPYYIEPIVFDDIDNLPKEYTIDMNEFQCGLCANEESYCLSDLNIDDDNSFITRQYSLSGINNSCSYFKSNGIYIYSNAFNDRYIFTDKSDDIYAQNPNLEIKPCIYNNTVCKASYLTNNDPELTYCIWNTNHLNIDQDIQVQYQMKGCYMNQPYFVDQVTNYTIFWHDIFSIWCIGNELNAISYYAYCDEPDIINCDQNWFFNATGSGFILDNITISGYCTSNPTLEPTLEPTTSPTDTTFSPTLESTDTPTLEPSAPPSDTTTIPSPSKHHQYQTSHHPIHQIDLLLPDHHY